MVLYPPIPSRHYSRKLASIRNLLNPNSASKVTLMDYQASIDLTSDIRLLVEPLVTHPEKIVIKRLDKEEDLYKKEQNYLVLCNKDDLGRLIGRHGVISDSLRTILNVSNKNMRKRIHLRFASNEETNE